MADPNSALLCTRQKEAVAGRNAGISLYDNRFDHGCVEMHHFKKADFYMLRRDFGEQTGGTLYHRVIRHTGFVTRSARKILMPYFDYWSLSNAFKTSILTIFIPLYCPLAASRILFSTDSAMALQASSVLLALCGSSSTLSSFRRS